MKVFGCAMTASMSTGGSTPQPASAIVRKKKETSRKGLFSFMMTLLKGKIGVKCEDYEKIILVMEKRGLIPGVIKKEKSNYFIKGERKSLVNGVKGVFINK
jgi:hypothetical protein